MTRFQELQDKHLELVARYEQDKSSRDLLADVQTYIEQVIRDSQEISGSRERNQLRANLRFWGAYVFDRTKTYPKLDLLPSKVGAAAPAPRGMAASPRWTTIAFLVLLAAIILFAAGYAFFILPSQRATQLPAATAQQPSETAQQGAATVQSTQDLPIAQALTATSQALTLPTLTATPPPTQTPVIAQATAATALATSTPGPAMATVEVALALAVGPVQGLAPRAIGFAPQVIYSDANCDSREIAIEWSASDSNSGPFPGLAKAEAPVAYLSLIGSGETVSESRIAPNGDATKIPLNEPQSDRSYLLQVKHSVFLFHPMILQFTSDCAYNNMSVSYGGQANVTGESPLDIDLALLDWGPDSHYSSHAWMAKLLIAQSQGGIYEYAREGDQPQIIENSFYVSGTRCASPPFTLSRISNGKYQEARLSLFLAGPLCPKPE